MKKISPLFNKQLVKTFFKGRIPGQVVIQYTDRCNATCPHCGMRATETFQRSRLETGDVKKIIEHAAQGGVKALSFTGGEPFLYFEDLIRLIKFAGEAGIQYTRTGTNGYIFSNPDRPGFEKQVVRIARSLADTNLRNFWISLDSARPELHQTMRGLPGMVRGIEKALPIFHRHGIYPSVNLGINRNIDGSPGLSLGQDTGVDRDIFYNRARQAFQNFYNFVIDLGFTIVNACYPMSIDPENNGGLRAVYGASSRNDVINFSKTERILLLRALKDTVPAFRSKIRIFTPLTSLHSLVEECGYPCRGGIDFFYIDAKDGNTYPCGYRGNESLGRFWDIDINNIHSQGDCRKCDWECFRDPSELFGPLLDLTRRPAALMRRVLGDGAYAGLWLSDVKYYGACDYFDGRKPPDYNKLAAF